MNLNFTGLFAGAGGLDLGFEMAGFQHGFSTDIDPWSVKSLQSNRQSWKVLEADIKEISPTDLPDSEIILSGFPCQGFSLGGNRKEEDERNYLFKEVVRLTRSKKPRYVLIENVLNLRTMIEPLSGKPFVDVISSEFEKLGYYVKFNVFRVSEHGVPQTRRRFIFIASKDRFPEAFSWPQKERETTAAEYLADLATNPHISLPNHCVEWGFKSSVHCATGEPFDPDEPLVPCRFSRTGSDGHPIRSLDAPFPAIDTATIWGWAHGNVEAKRKSKDRINGGYVRNPNSEITLWRISASKLRSFTDREYARLQTFPDEWIFHGESKRDIHKQVGNAVPVQFAYRIGQFVKSLYEAQTKGFPMKGTGSSERPLQFDLAFD